MERGEYGESQYDWQAAAFSRSAPSPQAVQLEQIGRVPLVCQQKDVANGVRFCENCTLPADHL